MRIRPRVGLLSILLLGGLTVCLAGPASAVPALPTEQTLEQPNGDTIDARLWGNEHQHGWETAEGYTITKNENGVWVYQSQEDGELVTTNLVVGFDSPSSLSKHLRPASPDCDCDQYESLALSPDEPEHLLPRTGTNDIPVVLINYNDTAPSIRSTSDYQRLFFGDDPSIADGPGSLADYIEEASYGDSSIDGTVAGWYVANNSSTHYGADTQFGVDKRPNELVREAVKKSDDDVNYADYDNDNDGVVEQVTVVYRGEAESASTNTDAIWPHHGSMAPVETDDGVTVSQYILVPSEQNGQITTIGTLAHEIGHAYGLPDLDDADDSSWGIGRWGLMAAGTHNGDSRPGASPAHPTAWSKDHLGWLTPTEVDQGESVAPTMDDIAGTEDYYKLGPNSGRSQEYFFAANRGHTGFDAAVPGDGVLITHVDSSLLSGHHCYPLGNDCNANETDALVEVEAADGQQDLPDLTNTGDSGDVYPSGSTTRFDSDGDPNSRYKGRVRSNVYATFEATRSSSLDATLGLEHPESVVVGSNAGELVANNTPGRSWTFSAPGGAVLSSPTAVNDTVHAGSMDGFLYGVDLSTGSEEYSYDTTSRIGLSSPTVEDGTVYIGDLSGTLHAYMPATNTTNWTVDLGSSINASPTTTGENVIVGDEDGTVYAIDRETGETSWSYDTGGMAVRSSPTVADGVAFVGTKAGDLVAIDTSTGEARWTYTAPVDALNTSPTVAAGIVYVGSNAGTIHAVDAESGVQIWTDSTPTGAIRSSPTLHNDTVFVGSDGGTIFALDAASGSQRWSNSAPTAAVRSSPTAEGDRVYVGSTDGSLYAIDESTGATEWTDSTPEGPVVSSPTVINLTAKQSTGSRISERTLGHHDSGFYEVDVLSDRSTTRTDQGTVATFVAEVENIGAFDGDSQTMTIEVGPEDTPKASASVSLTAGESQEVTLQFAGTSTLPAGKYPITVRSEDDFETVQLRIDAAPGNQPSNSGGGGGGGGAGGGGLGSAGGSAQPRSPDTSATTHRRGGSGAAITVEDPSPGTGLGAEFTDSPPRTANGVRLDKLYGTLTTRFDFTIEVELHQNRSRLSAATSKPAGSVLAYLTVDHNDHPIEDAGFRFTVEKQTLRENGIHPLDVVVYRFDGEEWQDFKPYLENTDGSAVTYELSTSSTFSTWAIAGSATSTRTPVPTVTPTPTAATPTREPSAGSEPTSTPTPTQTATPTATDTPSPTAVPTTTQAATTTESATTETATEGPGFGALLAIVAITVAGVALARRD